MGFSSRTAVLLGTAALLATSCTRVIDDAPVVAGADLGEAAAGDASQCTEVDVPLTTIETARGSEPVLRIPQPDGWERTTLLDSELVRFAMGNPSLTRDDFAPNVVVGLESAAVIEDPDSVFDGQRDGLESGLGATDLWVTEHTVCGLPAETVHYQMPVMGDVPPHPVTFMCVVLHADNTTYAASLSIQTTDPANETYQRDAEAIVQGFQVLPPLTE